MHGKRAVTRNIYRLELLWLLQKVKNTTSFNEKPQKGIILENSVEFVYIRASVKDYFGKYARN